MDPARVGPRQRRGIRVVSAVALLAGVTAVAPGCGAPGSLTQVANDLQAALLSMPGVSDAWVYHEESYAEGVIFNIAVDVPAATRQQLVDIADRIDTNRIGLISNYTQNVEFWVTPNRPVTLRRQAHFDPSQVADDAQQLRTLAAGSDGRIDWFRSEDGSANQLSIEQGRGPGAALLDVVRQTAGQTGVTMSVTPAAPSRQNPRLVVTFPFAADQQAAVAQLVNQVPVDVFGMRIDAGAVRAMEVMTHDPATAEQELTAVIDAGKAVSAKPMWLAWYYPTFNGAPVYGGVVEVHDCSVQPATGVQNVAVHSDAAGGVSTLQTRLQAKIDTCPAPAPAAPAESSRPAKTPNEAVQVAVPELRSQIAEGTRQTPSPKYAPCIGQPGCVTAGPGRVAVGGGGGRQSFPSPQPVLPGSGLPVLNLPLPAAGLPFFPFPPTSTPVPPSSSVTADPSTNSSSRTKTSTRSSTGGSARTSGD
ncbi:hypothetical protein MANY_06170 [Mycolicibacterium anyangense]|uniref:Uncharacterized protein n=1 Tax=Mycolicibacterium anyangense TaxID=1431246 RepID=A0A6N4W062_9MYCO|nr:hypothetical protein MANY_06170 [Mycolicibacterium anyangense]